MSSTGDPWADVQSARDGWQRTDDQLPRLRAVHGDLSSILNAVVRNTPDHVETAAAMDSISRLGGDDQSRRDALEFVSEPVLAGDQTVLDAFRDGRAVTTEADAVASALVSYVGGDSWSGVEQSVTSVIQPSGGPMAIDTTVLEQVVELFELAIDAAIAAREVYADELSAALDSAYATTDDAFPDLDEQPIALLPVRLETRFVDASQQTDGTLRELLVRVYPDQIHADTHEEELTDDEVVWGQNFWATMWYARHPDPSVVPDDPSAQYLQERLPSARLREIVAAIDPANFSTEHAKRYDELKERAWGQLLDRFGRERAAYIVHALEPTDEEQTRDLLRRPLTLESVLAQSDGGDDVADEDELSISDENRTSVRADDGLSMREEGDSAVQADDSILADTDSVNFEENVLSEDIQTALGEAGTVDLQENLQDAIGAGVGPSYDPIPELPEKVPRIEFSEVSRRPEAWTQQSRAALLPDRWIAIGEWTDQQGKTQRTAVAGDPIREPLPMGPNPESVAAAGVDETDSASPAPEGTDWMVDFDDAEAVGMGIRLALSGLTGFDPHRGFDRLTVVGVKASMDAETTPDAVSELLDAHHYTDGLAFLEQGTPTNNHDKAAGYTRSDDPRETMDIVCSPPNVTEGDRTDGDLLARALAISTDEDHVFANVENAGGTQQRDARHMNSALWPATLGYYFQNILIDNKFAGNDSLWNGSPSSLTESQRRDALDEPLLWIDAYRRHFVRYVRGRGPFPALRVGTQPYGILPTRPIETERDITLVDQGLVSGLADGTFTVDDVKNRGIAVEDLVKSGVRSDLLLEGGANPDELLAAGAEPMMLVDAGVKPDDLLSKSGLAPDALTQDGIGLLSTSRMTRQRLRSAGIPPEKLKEHSITVRSLARGEVTDDQLSKAGVTTKSLAEVLLPPEAKSLGITPAALEKAGVTPGALVRGEITASNVQSLGLDTRAVAESVLPRSVREFGVTPKKLEDAGISPEDLLNGTVTPEQLQDAGISTEALAEALLPEDLIDFGITPKTIDQSGISVADLFNGDVDIADLEKAGLNTRNLADALLPQPFRDAGITPESLESAGITPDAVLNGCVTPEDLFEAGLTPEALAEAGVLPDALADVSETFGSLLEAGLKPMELLEHGLTPKSLLNAGVDPQLLVDAGLAPKELVDAGMDIVELATSGAIPIQDLLESGASPAELARTGATIADLAGSDVPVGDLVKAGFTALDVLNAGADALGVAEAGARPSHLREAGVDAGTLRDAGKAAGSLRMAGYTAEELIETGYTARELLNGGFAPEELTAAGVDPADVQSTGRAVGELLAAGHPVTELRKKGYAAQQLLDAGVEVEALADAEYTAGELKDAGLSTQRLAEAGVDVESLRAAGSGVDSLAKAGVDARTLKETGASAQELLDSSFEPQDLLDAGFASVELEVAGIDVDQLAEDTLEGTVEAGEITDSVVQGLQYAVTVLEDPEQAERDLYSFSFDPAVPTMSQQADRRPSSEPVDSERGESDGGVVGGFPVVRPLSIDDRLPRRLSNRLVGFGTFWGDAVDSLPFAGDTDENALLNALKREGISADIRRQTMVYSGEASNDVIGQAVRQNFLQSQKQAVKDALTAANATDLDPRLAYFYPTDLTYDDIDPARLEGSQLTAYFYNMHLRRTMNEPIETHDFVDNDIGTFIDVLLGSSLSEVTDLSNIIFTGQLSIDPSVLDIEDSTWQNLDYGKKRGKIVSAIESADNPTALANQLLQSGGEGYSKVLQLAENQARYGDSGVLRSLLRMLLQNATLQAYISARLRLGQAYDELPEEWPETAYYENGQLGPLSALYEQAPKALGSHPNIGSMATVGEDMYTYEDALREAAANYSSSTSIDPRLSEFTDSLRYLAGVDTADLATLGMETLDLANHRLDAWWTSLATKRLFELREVQGTYDGDGGFDHEAWNGGGSDVPRATLEPGLLSGLDIGQTDVGDGIPAIDDTSGTPGGIETSTADKLADVDLSQTDSKVPDTGGTTEDSNRADSPESTDSTSDSATIESAGSIETLPQKTRVFDPAVLSNTTFALDGDTSDGDDSHSDGGFDLGPNIGTQASVDDGGKDSRPETELTLDEDTLANVSDIATRRQISDPGTIRASAHADPGLYVGGYAFVENLSADVEGRDEPEYVHAPSEQHATTAALLRSGSQAHDADEGENVMATDLSADRVRDGLRLIRGVRRGQSLGELLGYRFERQLHEETLSRGDEFGEEAINLMQYLSLLRAEFPMTEGKLQRPDEVTTQEKTQRAEEMAARDAVDGYQLLNHWEDYPFGRAGDLPETSSTAYDVLAQIVERLDETVDAAGDLLTAESVHQLGQGNFERTGASIGTLARGEPVPEPQIAQMPRTETGLTHRQSLVFGSQAAPNASTPRTQAEPALSEWVETLLPDHDDVGCLGTYRWSMTEPDPATGGTQEVEHTAEATITLSDLEIGPLDVLLLFGADREAARSELEQRLVYHLIRERPTDPAVPADATVELQLTEPHTAEAISMADLLELTRSIRDLVQQSRPLTAEDMVHPTDQRGEGYDTTTAQTLTERANTAQDQLVAVTRAIDERLAVLDSDHQVGDGTDGLKAVSTASADGGSPMGGSWDDLGAGVTIPGVDSPAIDVAFAFDRPTLTEQVGDVVSAVDTVEEDVPLSTVESIANSVDAGQLRSELTSLVETLPAGIADADVVDVDLTVLSTSGEAIEGTLGTPVEVPAVDTGSGADQSTSDGQGSDGGSGGDDGQGTGDSPTDDDEGDGDDSGHPSQGGPTTWTPAGREAEGTLLGTTVQSEETVEMSQLPEVALSEAEWYAENIDSLTVHEVGVIEDFGGDDTGSSDEDDSDSDSAGQGDDNGDNQGDTGGDDDTSGEQLPDWSGTTATVRVWGTDGLSFFQQETTTTPAADGSFSVDFDFSAVEPGTPFQAVAIVDGTVVYSASGRVVSGSAQSANTTQSTLDDDCPTLKDLLWLRDRQELFTVTEGPSAVLDMALDAVAFDGVQSERDAVSTAETQVTSDDIDAVDDLLALDGFEPGALATSVDRSVSPISKLGVDKLVEVAGGDGPPADVDFWYSPSIGLSESRARLTRTLSNPALYNAGAAPWLLSYHHDTAAVLHGMAGGEDIAAYLDAFVSQPPWTVRYLDQKVTDPATLLQELQAWLYEPSEVTDLSDLATTLHDLASVVTDLPALAVLFEGLDTGPVDSHLEAFKIHLQGLASTIGNPVPSIPDATTAKSTFDAEASTATTDLLSDATNEQSMLSPLFGSTLGESFRRIVLEQLRQPMTVAASYGVFGGTPTSADGGSPEDESALLEQARALLERLRKRLKDAAPLDPRLAAPLANRPVAQRVEDQSDRLETLFGDGFTVLPPFSVANPDELVATFTDDSLVPNDGPTGESWLQRAASFRENVARFREARSYAEVLAETLTPSLTVGQVPYEPGDTWVGVDGVEPASGKLSLVAQFGPGIGAGTVDGRVTGLFVDEWTEAVPADSEKTGVALNYDDPGARAPQSILLATPPADGEWSLDHLAATIDETAEYVKRRSVDLGDIDGLSPMFPALYFAQQDDPSPPTPRLELGMLEWYDRELVAQLLPPEAYLDFRGVLSND